MGNNMSAQLVIQQIKDRVTQFFPFANGGGNHDRPVKKRRADHSEDLNILPTKSRKVDQILREYSEYSDHEMDVFDVEERKKELQKRRQRGSMFNGYSGNSTSGAPSLFLSTRPLTVGTPLYVVNTSSLGTPIASSSLVHQQNEIRMPGLVPIKTTKRKPVPAAVPILNDTYNNFRCATQFGMRGKMLATLGASAASEQNTSKSTHSDTSIFKEHFKNDSRKDYLALLQKLAPLIYKKNATSSTADERKSIETQTETIDLTTSENTAPSIKEVVDLTDEKIGKDEEVNALMLKLNCKSFYNTKPENLRDMFEERRKEQQRKIREEEAVLQKCQEDTEKQQKSIRKRILDTPIPFESIIIQLDKAEVVEEEKTAYPVFTKQHLERIKRAVSGGSPSEVIVSKFNMSITRNDLNTLMGMTWLNDEVINFYMNLIMQRSQDNQNLPKAYCFNTFFIPTLMSRGHAGVKRWTRKVDIFSYDLIPVPVHVGKIHWCMAIIRVKEKVIRYYDSMGNPNQPVLEALEQYLVDEAYDKKKETLDTSDWVKQNVTDCPHQTNGSDCGVFSCMFAEHLTRNAGFTFSQNEMPYFRHKMIYEIATGELMT